MTWLFRAISWLPLAFLHALGGLLGWLVYGLSPTYRRRFKANVAQAGIAWPEARPAIAAAGRMAAELPWLWVAQSCRPLGSKLQWDGAEHVEAALAAGKGLVLLTPHLGCFEICAQAIAERFTTPEAPITVLYRPARQASLREVMAGSRERPGLATAPAQLRRAPDDPGPAQGRGRGPAAGSGPARGAGRPGRLFWSAGLHDDARRPAGAADGRSRPADLGRRLPAGRGYVVHVLPAPDIAPDASPEAAAATVNAAMESLIRRAPGQYLWGYHRYKQPRGLDIGAAPRLLSVFQRRRERKPIQLTPPASTASPRVPGTGAATSSEVSPLMAVTSRVWLPSASGSLLA